VFLVTCECTAGGRPWYYRTTTCTILSSQLPEKTFITVWYKMESKRKLISNLLKWKRCMVRLYLHLLARGLMSYLQYLCLFAYSGVQRILCCVFALLAFVLDTLYYQFLWIIHFWLPIRYSLTFFICHIFQIFVADWLQS